MRRRPWLAGQTRRVCAQGGQGRGVGDGVEQRVGAEVGAGRLDGEPELGDEVVVVGRPLGAGGDAGHPDPVPDELGGRH
jgi:hypothetical protein